MFFLKRLLGLRTYNAQTVKQMKKLLSGVQPTGDLHIGNYLGSIKNWVDLQSEYKCLFPIVDLHAITSKKTPAHILQQNIKLTAAAYIACGVDPDKAMIFQQSAVPYHTELAWIFSCVTQMGWLNRMTQFKEKSAKTKQTASLALYSYPVLMAADILLYKADLVPVGEDQTQHLELTNDIGAAFNHHFESEYFDEVKIFTNKQTKRIMSLRDGTSKMSKSDISDYSRINLTDDADTILKKIKKAKTDSIADVTKDIDNRPEIKNLLNIYAAFSNKEPDDIIEQYKSAGFEQFKKELADVIITNLAPITSEINKLRADDTYLSSILKNGAAKASEIAEANMQDIKRIVGLAE
jgi:tryptophanyl-tRNA synthetase